MAPYNKQSPSYIRDQIILGIYGMSNTKKKERSGVWKTFKIVVDENKEAMKYAACTICKKVYTYSGNATGTSTLLQHQKKCKVSNLENVF